MPRETPPHDTAALRSCPLLQPLGRCAARPTSASRSRGLLLRSSVRSTHTRRPWSTNRMEAGVGAASTSRLCVYVGWGRGLGWVRLGWGWGPQFRVGHSAAHHMHRRSAAGGPPTQRQHGGGTTKSHKVQGARPAAATGAHPSPSLPGPPSLPPTLPPLFLPPLALARPQPHPSPAPGPHTHLKLPRFQVGSRECASWSAPIRLPSTRSRVPALRSV